MANLLKLLEPLLKIADVTENHLSPEPSISENNKNGEKPNRQSKTKTVKQTKTQGNPKNLSKKTSKKLPKKTPKKIKKQKKKDKITKKNFL